jgi:hypothetical protein
MTRSPRARIAAIARGEAKPPRGTAFSNKDGGRGYCSSADGNNGQPEFWCADFVKFVWHKAGVLNTGSPGRPDYLGRWYENGHGEGEAEFPGLSGVYKDGPYSVSGPETQAAAPSRASYHQWRMICRLRTKR